MPKKDVPAELLKNNNSTIITFPTSRSTGVGSCKNKIDTGLHQIKVTAVPCIINVGVSFPANTKGNRRIWLSNRTVEGSDCSITADTLVRASKKMPTKIGFSTLITKVGVYSLNAYQNSGEDCNVNWEVSTVSFHKTTNPFLTEM